MQYLRFHVDQRRKGLLDSCDQYLLSPLLIMLTINCAISLGFPSPCQEIFVSQISRHDHRQQHETRNTKHRHHETSWQPRPCENRWTWCSCCELCERFHSEDGRGSRGQARHHGKEQGLVQAHDRVRLLNFASKMEIMSGDIEMECRFWCGIKTDLFGDLDGLPTVPHERLSCSAPYLGLRSKFFSKDVECVCNGRFLQHM